MNFKQVAEQRYTTKKYDATKKVAPEHIEELKAVLRLSPSSINSQPWKYAFVADAEVKAKLAEASFFNANKVKDCSHLVVFSAIDNLEAFEAQINAHLPAGAVGYYNDFLKALPEHEIKAWFGKQVYLSIGFFLAACAAMGIDSTPMEGIVGDEYRKILNLENHQPLVAVAIGYRDANDGNQPALTPKSRLDLEAVLDFI